ncbi:MAG: hypothetical protein HYV03_04320 [Deltaproteobacteria bacterium]|nr:hypothetical protein [Deltaproteobacteria bacterium]
MRYLAVLCALASIGWLSDCRNQTPAPAAAPTKPDIVEVMMALDIDSKTLKPKGGGTVFPLSVMNRQKKVKVALHFTGLRGGETLTLTVVDPTGTESAPIVQQYGPEERGEFVATAYFEADRWRPGPHELRVNLNDQSFAIYPFLIDPRR